jgi:glycine cleavage system H protein
MEPFHYYNIFETKGIEYLITVVFFLSLIPFWIMLNNRDKIAKGIRQALGVLSMKKLRIPQGIFYSPGHTWTYLRRNGTARVGVDDLLLSITGPFAINPQIKSGVEVKKGDVLALIIQQDKELSVKSPVSGILKSANIPVFDHPADLMEDPYGKGWMFEIKPSAWKEETAGYYLAEEAVAWTQGELVRFKDFLAVSLQRHNETLSLIALQDGGELREHLLSDLPKEVWFDFEHEFLAPQN